MSKNDERKIVAKEKMNIAIENFKQAELEGAEVIAPVTYRWAKSKIYNNRKIILKLTSDQSRQEEAAEDACAASAQLLSVVRNEIMHPKEDLLKIPELIEEKEIDNFVNEGGPVL